MTTRCFYRHNLAQMDATSNKTNVINPFVGGVKKHRLLVVDKYVDRRVRDIYFLAATFLTAGAFFVAAFGAAAFFSAGFAAFLTGLFGAAPTFLGAAAFFATLGAALGEAFALTAATLGVLGAAFAAAGFGAATNVTMNGFS